MNRQAVAVGMFFLLLLAGGLLIFKDYGVCWDEPIHEWRGRAFLDYVIRGDQRLLENEVERNYGSFPDILLAVLQKAVSKDSRTLYLTRHLAFFLIFYAGVWFFYLLGRKIFGRWEMALLGCVFLVLSPRVFAHSFYNPKDIPLMTAVIAALFALIKFMERPNLKTMIWLALACAVATDVRLMGMLTFFLAGVGILFLLWERRKKGKKLLAGLGLALGFMGLYAGLTILFWPTLWDDPVGRFISVYRFSSHHPWPGAQLYLGRYYACGDTPWHYIPVWIGIATPLLYLGLFLLGVGAFLLDILKKVPRTNQTRAWGTLVLLWFFVPPVASILLNVCTYNEYRHLFFIYPALLLIALRGWRAILDSVSKINQRELALAGKILILTVMVAGMGRTAVFMVKNHPHENVYFNRLAGRDMVTVSRNFELDYWGLSYKQGLEYLLRVDPSETIVVAVDNRPGEYNTLILPLRERQRPITFRPLYIPLRVNRKILRFAARRPSKYFVNPRFHRLVVRSKMTPEERDELLRLTHHPQEKEAIEQTYLNSQGFRPMKYFLTNYTSTYPGEFFLPQIHSIKVGNASILGIYRLEDAR